MQQVSIEKAREQLSELIEAAAAGEQIYISHDDHLCVELVPHVIRNGMRHFGSARGLISMAPDFDEPLEDFAPYME